MKLRFRIELARHKICIEMLFCDHFSARTYILGQKGGTEFKKILANIVFMMHLLSLCRIRVNAG